MSARPRTGQPFTIPWKVVGAQKAPTIEQNGCQVSHCWPGQLSSAEMSKHFKNSKKAVQIAPDPVALDPIDVPPEGTRNVYNNMLFSSGVRRVISNFSQLEPDQIPRADFASSPSSIASLAAGFVLELRQHQDAQSRRTIQCLATGSIPIVCLSLLTFAPHPLSGPP